MRKLSRRKERAQLYEARKKEALRLLRRINEIYRLQHTKIELNKPRQIGYKRIFVIRPDLRHSSEVPTLLRILEHTQNTQYSPTKDFLLRGEKRPHLLETLYEWQYAKLPGDLQKYFVESREWNRWTDKFQTVYRYRYPWKFISVIVPNYEKTTRLSFSNLDAEAHHLNNKLFHHDMLCLKYLEHSSYPDSKSRYERQQKLRKALDREALDEINKHKFHVELD